MQQLNTTTYISTATTTVIYAGGNCFVHRVNVPIALTGTVTFESATAGTYFVLPIGTVGSFEIDSIFANGLSVVTSAADKLTVHSTNI